MNYDIGSTHIPILIAVGLKYPIKTVLELGTGYYSTPTFLNREVFPDLEELISYEDDPKWRYIAMETYKDVRMHLVEELPSPTHPYDLIFVDNSQSGVTRAQTIRRVAEEATTSLCVIHDAEDVNYIPEICRFKQTMTIKTYDKWTALATNNLELYLCSIDPKMIIEQNLHLYPTDVRGWLEVLR